MSEQSRKRATIYFDPSLHRALKLRAAETERSVSEFVNEAVHAALAEDAADLDTFEVRAGEPSYAFGDVVADLKQRGKI